jgi:hypothetical protein
MDISGIKYFTAEERKVRPKNDFTSRCVGEKVSSAVQYGWFGDDMLYKLFFTLRTLR